MNTYVRAIYDFEGQADLSEISIRVGDILTVTQTDIGDGWWEGRNSQGQVGLFPAAYVKAISAAEAPGSTTQPYEEDSDSDTDWDNESVSHGNSAGGDTSVYRPTAAVANYEGETASSGSGAMLKKTSMFGRVSDSYILGLATRDKLPDSEIVRIVQVDGHYYWQAPRQPYSVVVASPAKKSKFKGIKTYIDYQVASSFNNISVARRYKRFDWLYKRLASKFCLIPIPPLPDKQVSGRYEEQFIEHRRHLFQEFVDWVARHPVLSGCEVWHHFLTCSDDDKVWKAGKRRAEQDPYIGMTYCLAISPPDKDLLKSQVDSQMEQFGQFVHAMDGSVKSLYAIVGEAAKRNQMQCRKEFQRIGDGFADLAKALIIDEQRAAPAPGAKPLSTNVARIGSVFIDIGKIHDSQAKTNWITLSDRLYIYRGVLNQFVGILSTHKDAMQKRKECERMIGERGNNVQMVDVNRRTDVISYAVMAEMSHFKQERETHMRQALKSFIEEQIQFYSNVVAKLQEAHKYFD